MSKFLTCLRQTGRTTRMLKAADELKLKLVLDPSRSERREAYVVCQIPDRFRAIALQMGIRDLEFVTLQEALDRDIICSLDLMPWPRMEGRVFIDHEVIELACKRLLGELFKYTTFIRPGL